MLIRRRWPRSLLLAGLLLSFGGWFINEMIPGIRGDIQETANARKSARERVGLDRGDAVEAGCGRDSFDGAGVEECSILLDGEDADGSVSRIEGEEEFAVGADSNVKIPGPIGILAYNSTRERGQQSSGGDCKS